MTWEEAAKKCGTDKLRHGYIQHYERHIPTTVKSVLEIGVEGGRSLRLWESVFSDAQIHGVDCNARCTAQQTERTKIHLGRQEDSEFLAGVAQHGPFDLIVDDGSHEPAHQLASFSTLWDSIKEGGWYVVEDIYPSCTNWSFITNLYNMINRLYIGPEQKGVHHPIIPATRNWLPQTYGETYLGEIHAYRAIVFMRKIAVGTSSV